MTFGVVDAGSADRAAPAFLDWPANLLPDIAGPAGAPVPPRTPRISPRRPKSVLRWSIDRPGSLTAPGFSGGLAPGLGRNWMNPTLSPNFGPGGGGGGGGGASMTGSGLVSGGGSLMSLGGGVGAVCVGAAGAVGGATGAATAGAASDRKST